MRKWVRLFFLILAVGLIGLLATEIRQGWNGKDDLRIGIIADKKIGIVSVSPERRMISVASTDEGTRLWIPRGWGWYEADKVGKIVDQAGVNNLDKESIFYNFGFIPEKIIRISEFDDWKNDWTMWESLGWWNWVLYKLNSRGLMLNVEGLTSIDDPATSEILLRDFSDNNILSKDTRVTVVNATEESGFAQFIAERMEWLGMSVVGLENSGEKVEVCSILVNNENSRKMDEVRLMQELWNCPILVDSGVPEGEIYLNLGEGLAQMLKYSSYK